MAAGAGENIKGVLGSFCVLDSERRFELFQMAARLEARWAVPLSPAIMHAITDRTEHSLYKQHLEPYMKTMSMLEPEGARLLEAHWMAQELPKPKPSMVKSVIGATAHASTPWSITFHGRCFGPPPAC